MLPLPETKNPIVLRTDFSNDWAWKSICDSIKTPFNDFVAHVTTISHPAYEKLSIEQLLTFTPQDSAHTFIFMVDHMSLTHLDQPILCIDLCDEPGLSFRLSADTISVVENNLSLANMDFETFARAVDGDGIFRGF